MTMHPEFLEVKDNKKIYLYTYQILRWYSERGIYTSIVESNRNLSELKLLILLDIEDRLLNSINDKLKMVSELK